MSKKLFKMTPIGMLAGALKGKKKKAAPTTPAPEVKGPIVTPLGGATPTAPLRRGKVSRPGTIVGSGLNTTLGG